MKVIMRISFMIILCLCTHTTQLMAIDYQKLSKQSDDQLRQELFPTDYHQKSLDQKIHILHSYIREVKNAENKTQVTMQGLQRAGDTQNTYYKNLEYEVHVYPRVITIYEQELARLNKQKK